MGRELFPAAERLGDGRPACGTSSAKRDIDRCVRRMRSTEKNMEKQKCTVTADGKFVEPCKTLADATEFGNPNGKRKGVWSWEYHSRDKPGPTRRFWGTKSGEFVSNGLAFNYCPFCGEKIDAPFTEPSNAQVTGASPAFMAKRPVD